MRFKINFYTFAASVCYFSNLLRQLKNWIKHHKEYKKNGLFKH